MSETVVVEERERCGVGRKRKASYMAELGSRLTGLRSTRRPVPLGEPSKLDRSYHAQHQLL